MYILYIYTYVYLYIHMYIYVYIYIYGNCVDNNPWVNMNGFGQCMDYLRIISMGHMNGLPSGKLTQHSTTVENHQFKEVNQQTRLVGGLEHFLLSHILGISSSQVTHIFQRGGPTTNQNMIINHAIGLPWVAHGSPCSQR